MKAGTGTLDMIARCRAVGLRGPAFRQDGGSFVRRPLPAQTAPGYSERTGNFKRSMDKLLAAGFLAMTLPDKPTSRLQKYRLTAKGRAALAALQSERSP